MRAIAIPLRHHFSGCPILGVGAFHINGSVLDFFHDYENIGIEVADGKGVDAVRVDSITARLTGALIRTNSNGL